MRSALALIMSLIFGGQAVAATATECKQGHSIYSDAAGAYRLSFNALESDAAAAELEFKLEIVGRDISFNGYLMASEPESDANAILFRNCPEGDVTGADLSACTVWEGFLHVKQKTTTETLPAAGESAATDIYLPGIGPSLKKFLKGQEAKDLPISSDLFSFKGCQA